MNPYVADKPTIDRLVEAADRGVKVRIVIPGKPTPTYPAAAFRHNYPRLLEAGVTILAHPDMAHAKVLVADDRALVGGCNFDALSLYENWELDLLFEDAAVAQRVSDDIVGRFAAVATPVEAADGPEDEGVGHAHGPDQPAVVGASLGGGPAEPAAAAARGHRRRCPRPPPTPARISPGALLSTPLPRGTGSVRRIEARKDLHRPQRSSGAMQDARPTRRADATAPPRRIRASRAMRGANRGPPVAYQRPGRCATRDGARGSSPAAGAGRIRRRDPDPDAELRRTSAARPISREPDPFEAVGRVPYPGKSTRTRPSAIVTG